MQSTKRTFRIGIVGGGAAGLMSTIWAQRTAHELMPKNHKFEIVLLERKEQCGKKILMSGGTRCNILPHVSKWSWKPTEMDINQLHPSYTVLGNRFFTQQPEILEKILRTWSITDQKEFFERELGLKLRLEEETGKYFPQSNDAREVLNVFTNKIASYKKPPVYTKILTNSNVEALEKTIDTNTGQCIWKVKFREDKRSDLLKTRNPEKPEKIQELVFDKLIIASGGLSVINRDGACIQLLYKLGHRIIPLFPALTPLLSHPDVRALHKELAGISTQKVIISVVLLDVFNQTTRSELIHKASDPDAFLFTHRGYSGPAILNASHHTMVNEYLEPLQYSVPIEQGNQNISFDINDGDSIENLMFHIVDNPKRRLCLEVNWTPEISLQDWDRLLVSAQKKGTKQLVKNFVQKTCQGNMFLPIRLIELLLNYNEDMSNLIVSQLTKEQRHKIINQIVRYRILINGNEGLKKAEVTGGGVDLRDIDSVTLESRVQPNLYICGEAMDAFGCIGGFNFAIAWITGKMAGISAVSSLLA